MGEKLGGKNIGGPLVAVGTPSKQFDNITIPGEVHGMDLIITGKLISTGAAFLAKNPSGASKAARGADDVDLILDAIFTNAKFMTDESVSLFDGELMSRVRAYITEELGGRDPVVTGALVDGASIPVSTGAAIAFMLRMHIPFSLRDEVFPEDGDSYKQGTERLKEGGFYPRIAMIAGAVALSNGNATLSNLAFDMVPAIDPDGDPFYCGPTYKMASATTEKAESTTLPRAKRLYLIAEDVTRGPYTVKDGPVVLHEQLDTASIVDFYNRDRKRQGGDNACGKGIPLIFPRRNLKLAERDFTPTQPYVKEWSSGANQVLVSITHEPLNETVAARVKGAATTANAGQPTQAIAVAPPSVPDGEVHTRNRPILGRHIVAKK